MNKKTAGNSGLALLPLTHLNSTLRYAFIIILASQLTFTQSATAQGRRTLPPILGNPTMTKSKVQIVIILIGLLFTGLGVKTMLETPTVILSSLSLVLTFLPLTLIGAWLIGLITKKVTKSSFHILTFMALNMTILCGAYYISQYRPTYEIIVHENFSGQVRLCLTKDAENDFFLNTYGIGYINSKTFKNGFTAKVIRNGEDITSQTFNYSRSSYAGSGEHGSLSIDYLSFYISGETNSNGNLDFNQLITLGALDSTRLDRE